MVASTEIEKKSLEAHVELCSERYASLNDKLDILDNRVNELERKLESKMESVEHRLDEIKDMITKMQHHRNNQIIGWGVGLVGSLVGLVGFLVWHLIGRTL